MIAGNRSDSLTKRRHEKKETVHHGKKETHAADPELKHQEQEDAVKKHNNNNKSKCVDTLGERNRSQLEGRDRSDSGSICHWSQAGQ